MSVVITGLGAICALGNNSNDLWKAIKEGRSGISQIKRFDVTTFDTQWGALVPEGDNSDSDETRLLTYAYTAAKEALEQSVISNRDAVPLVLGTSNGLKGDKIYQISHKLADKLQIKNMIFTFSTACTSSAHALGFAADLIKRGYSDYVLAGGADILTLNIFAGFYSLGLLSKMPCAPFSKNFGTTLGEGAAFFLLESDQSARKRKIKPLASLMGYGISADGFHDTKPDPGGAGVFRAIDFALKDSGVNTSKIEYINAHGTATAANDSAEWQGILRALGKNASNIPISSSKSFLGHTQGAAGALEALTTLISVNNNSIPPTLNYISPRSISPKDPVASNSPRPKTVKYTLSTNSGFGGVNSALVFGPAEIKHSLFSGSPRSISIIGMGINMVPDHINKYVPDGELRGLDLSAKLLAGAVAKTLISAGIRFRSIECEKVGLFVGQENLSLESAKELDISIKKRGIKHLSASAFTRMVVNYPTGVSCRLFGLKGPTATLAAKPDSGLAALLYALDYLAWRRDTELMLVAEVNEEPKNTKKKPGAISVLLKVDDKNAPFSISGWSYAKDLESAKNNALNMAMIKSKNVRSSLGSNLPVSPGLFSLTKDLNNYDKNDKRPLLITTNNTDQMGIAVILERRN